MCRRWHDYAGNCKLIEVGWTAAFAGLIAVLSLLLSSTVTLNQRPANAGRVQHFATSLIVYHDAVEKYARANSSSVGAIPDASLALPNWYANPGWANSVTTDGVARSYLPQPNAMFRESRFIAGELAVRVFGATTVGTVQGTSYFNPSVGVVIAPTVVAGLTDGTVFISTKVR
jgi:hypothetical protein